MGATATYELDTELDKDAQAIYQRGLDMNKVSLRQFVDFVRKYLDVKNNVFTLTFDICLIFFYKSC